MNYSEQLVIASAFTVMGCLVAYAPPLKAERTITQNYELATWHVSGDAFHCQLSQKLDNYAKLSVVSKPARAQYLDFEWLLTERAITDVRVFTRKGDWQNQHITAPTIQFFSADIVQQQVMFVQGVAPLLSAIKQGYWLDTIIGFGDEQLRLTFPTTHSDSAINQYQQCREQLAPLSWQQARDYEISFDSGERVVKRHEDLSYLEKLVRYIQLDPTVNKVMIDGHTDNVGSPLANRLLSKERADDVASRLIELGIDSQLIEIRAHGGRYPVANNADTSGQSSNRRVLIRLFRQNS
ncbi:MotY family protein [Pseudoalteromonas prydzensis]|uniref:MotY family protein n=1 Tax=Pseudoalteromonas prydzensis TaxID=182141 RepID=UPI0007E50D22|nr:OmpA family protein [Pseudoalteromonas prydzensis]MBE0378083.1 hypothetical protein [Pseudoalteromonas prydzensis ACAM 620]